jgi:hypothetical protein
MIPYIEKTYSTKRLLGTEFGKLSKVAEYKINDKNQLFVYNANNEFAKNKIRK